MQLSVVIVKLTKILVDLINYYLFFFHTLFVDLLKHSIFILNCHWLMCNLKQIRWNCKPWNRFLQSKLALNDALADREANAGDKAASFLIIRYIREDSQVLFSETPFLIAFFLLNYVSCWNLLSVFTFKANDELVKTFVHILLFYTY